MYMEKNQVLYGLIIAGGKIKTIVFMHYLTWHIINGFNDYITYNFIIQGHTKFSPDGCFGGKKKSYRKKIYFITV